LEDVDTIVVETAERLFEQLFDPHARIDPRDADRLDRVWQAIAELGLPLALISADAGGFGIGEAAALRIIRLIGRYAAPVPLAETMLANRLLSEAGLPSAEGMATVAATGLMLDGERLTGTARRVPWGTPAAVVAVAQGKIALVPAGKAGTDTGVNLAGEPRDTLHFDLVLPSAAIAPTAATRESVHAQLALIRAQSLAGAIERTVEMTAAFAAERSQFGRALAKFQVIQHNLALMAGHAASATAAADMALGAIDGAIIPIAVAKGRTSEAAGQVAAMAHQIHGAIGFTLEHALHLLTTRLWAWRDEQGSEADWYRLIGEQASAGPLWPFLLGEAA